MSVQPPRAEVLGEFRNGEGVSLAFCFFRDSRAIGKTLLFLGNCYFIILRERRTMFFRLTIYIILSRTFSMFCAQRPRVHNSNNICFDSFFFFFKRYLLPRSCNSGGGGVRHWKLKVLSRPDSAGAKV